MVLKHGNFYLLYERPTSRLERELCNQTWKLSHFKALFFFFSVLLFPAEFLYRCKNMFCYSACIFIKTVFLIFLHTSVEEGKAAEGFSRLLLGMASVSPDRLWWIRVVCVCSSWWVPLMLLLAWLKAKEDSLCMLASRFKALTLVFIVSVVWSSLRRAH